MTPEQHARGKALFIAACALPAAERDKLLADECRDDAELRRHVEDLLANSSGPAAPKSDGATRTGAASEASSTVGDGPQSPAAAPDSRRAGAIVAERFRIVTLLGSGGMGEVYRADDLTLNQTVALKFLSPEAHGNPAWLERFRQEVRLARQIAHPNVCRVYELHAVGDEHFLSMEYIDGEDLKTLLQRIGRLPPDKAIEIARQVCSGLAAAHGRGVLHRDLKPSNIMLDGKGQGHITDFGLAALPQDIKGHDVRAGTPAYMAPEQLAGEEVTVRSDIYSLGLVLYELFTGKPAFEARSYHEFLRLKKSTPPTAPSSLVPEIDAATESVILRCIDPNPRERYESVLAVAAALPGGDPLAAALAAGQTPSPELVAAAASPERRGLPRAALLGALGVLLVAALLLQPLSHSVWMTPLEKPPQVLAERAREIVRAIDPASPAFDEASGLADLLTPTGTMSAPPGAPRPESRGSGVNPTDAPRPTFASAQPAHTPVQFWYRTSPDWLVPLDPFNLLFGNARVTSRDPPLTRAGMVSLVLDPSGRLLALDIVSPLLQPASPPRTAVDWTPLLALAGLDPAGLTPCDPQLIPGVVADRRRAWCGAHPDNADQRIRVEAAECDARPVALAVLSDPPPARLARWWDEPAWRAGLMQWAWRGLIGTALLIAIPLTYWNLTHNRSDRRGALRLAAFVYALRVVTWLLQAQHTSDVQQESSLLLLMLVGALAEAGVVWLLYVGLEPLVRRYWPHVLIAWSRVLAGRWRDPLVGRDLLLGAALGALWTVLVRLDIPLTGWLGLSPRPIVRPDDFLAPLLGTRSGMAACLDALRTGIYQALALLMLLAALRIVLKRPLLAGVVGALLMMPTLVPRGSNPLTSAVLIGLLGFGAFVWVMIRYGLLPIIVGMFVATTLVRAPLTLDMRAWYADASVFALLLTAGVAGAGFALSGRGAGLARGSEREAQASA